MCPGKKANKLIPCISEYNCGRLGEAGLWGNDEYCFVNLTSNLPGKGFVSFLEVSLGTKLAIVCDLYRL